MDGDEAKDKKTNETYFEVQELTKKNDCEKRTGRGKALILYDKKY
jgi:hypothetical protein